MGALRKQDITTNFARCRMSTNGRANPAQSHHAAQLGRTCVFISYIHTKPGKHGHAEWGIDWPYSSFRLRVARGVYPANWVASPDVLNFAVGE